MTESVRRALTLAVFAVSAAAVVFHSPPASAQAAAPAAQVGGSWDTEWGDSHAVLDLTQTGTKITGAYSGSNQGKVTGTIAGRVLTGTWAGTVPGDNGGFVLDFKPDGKSFTGTWGGGTSRTNGGPWVGIRK
ncbi:MAG TPA: hypothetical protein VGI48_00330 [Caldimonas sp.]|jgi:uncharacterized protein (DUF2147 family)